jgi:hypothetical protein
MNIDGGGVFIFWTKRRYYVFLQAIFGKRTLKNKCHGKSQKMHNYLLTLHRILLKIPLGGGRKMKKTWLGIPFIFILVLAVGLNAAIYINSPHSGFTYDAGHNLNISWFAEPAGTPPASTKLSVWLRTETALVQIGNNVPAGNGSLNWLIPRLLFGDKMSVSIFRQGTSELLATSPGIFSIIPPTRIQLLSPNGGDTFRPGGTILVRWRATDIVPEHHQFASIFLVYYPGGCRVGDPVVVRVSSEPSRPGIASGETGCRLTIPSSAPLSSSYVVEIQVQSVDYITRLFNKGNSDESDRCFTIAR